MRKAMLLLAAMAAAVLVAMGAALAQTAPQGTLDADNLNQQPSSMAAIDSNFASGQTFTATRGGELTGARVFLAKLDFAEALTVEIAKVDAGSGFPAVPEDVLASTTKPASDFPAGSNTLSSLQPVDIVFDTPASVVAGERYALILKAKDNSDLFLSSGYNIGSTGDPFNGGGDTYPGGERIYQRCPFGAIFGSRCTTPPTNWQSIGGPDLIFGIYVASTDTTPPEISGIPTSDLTATATGPSGAVVDIPDIRATDDVDGPVDVSCASAAGDVTPNASQTFPVGKTEVTCSAKDAANNAATEKFNVVVSYDFTGFFSPVDNWDPENPVVNQVNGQAGKVAIPVKFSLNGDMGLEEEIFADGSPSWQESSSCDSTSAQADVIEQTVPLSGGTQGTLKYDAANDQYIYHWNTTEDLKGKCVELNVKPSDGTDHKAIFHFNRN